MAADYARAPILGRFPLLGAALVPFIGSVFILVTPAGLPYDEPSHWQNVLFLQQHHSFPVIGSPGTSYEAQMGPLAYVVFAVGSAPLRVVGVEASFYAARAIGLLELILLAYLVWRLVQRVVPGHPRLATTAALLCALNPMLLAMSCSVQNDTLALVLATGCLLTAPQHRRSGVLAGLALLTKITMWPVVLVVLLSQAFRRGFRPTFEFILIVTAIFGWWPVRNLVMYRDLTGRAAVERAGYHFPPLPHPDPVSLLRGAITYLWLPTEYVRNSVAAPTIIDMAVLLATIIVLAVGVRGVRDCLYGNGLDRNALVELSASASLAVVAWLVVVVTSQAVAFRFAYAALPMWFLLGGQVSRTKGGTLALAAGLIGLDAWFLVAVHSQPALLFNS